MTEVIGNCWSRIGTDYDTDEETANFGTRYAFEAEGLLFDVFTYVTVCPQVKKSRRRINIP